MSNLESAQKYRAKDREAYNAKYRAYYKRVKATKLLEKRDEARKKRMEGKRCLSCTIRMDGSYGAFNTKKYCARCVETGDSKRHATRLATRKYRLKLKNMV